MGVVDGALSCGARYPRLVFEATVSTSVFHDSGLFVGEVVTADVYLICFICLLSPSDGPLTATVDYERYGNTLCIDATSGMVGNLLIVIVEAVLQLSKVVKGSKTNPVVRLAREQTIV